MSEYKYTPEKLYEATDNGLDILHRYLPDSVGCERNKGKKFKLRNERTSSVSIFKGDECWLVYDHGSKETFSPIDIVMQKTGLEYYEALQHLYDEFNVMVNSTFFAPNKTFSDKGDKPDDYFFIKAKDKVENSTRFSNFVTAQICEEYNVYEVEYYEKVTSEKKVLMRVNATPDYPIFCYSDDLEKWAKIYCPAEKKRRITDENGKSKEINFKHGYLGKKPEKYYHGLSRIKKQIAFLQESNQGSFDFLIVDETVPYINDLKEDNKDKNKLPYVVLCSGGSDGLTIASLSDDFFPVWGNSENDIIDYQTYEYLKANCKQLFYLPDVDTSGINFAYKYSQKYWKLDIVFLPKYFLGEKGKDFRDYVSYFTKKNTPKEVIASEFKKLINVPVSCDFVSQKDKKYRVNVRSLHYFLNSEGFFGYTPEFFASDKHNETADYLIRIDGFKVEEPTSKQVREFCVDYLIRKGTNTQVLELVKGCNALRNSDLATVPLLEEKLDFTDATESNQLFFFENTAVKVTDEAIKVIPSRELQNYVWQKNIIPHQFRVAKPFFEAYETETGQKRVNILQNGCDFMNFVINTCRMHWDKEYLAQGDVFRKKFILNSAVLSEDEQITQESHFLGKCFAIGYLLHNYKRRGFEKFVYMIDDKVKEETGENNGRSGKGLLIQGVSMLAPYFYVNGKSKRMFDDPHLLGSYKNQKLIFFDDMLNNDTTHGFDFLYSMITEGIVVNQKNVGSYHIPYERAPKLVGTYNHALRNPSNSTLGRILFVLFSDYYHYTSDVHKESYLPEYDFGGQLFRDWDEAQWYLFFNFMLQCLQLYLNNIRTPLLSPTGNLEINSIKASMGDNFMEWADGYFLDDKLNTNLNKKDVYEDYKRVMGRMHTTAQRFRKNLENYCKYKGYELNPKEKCGVDGRILINEYISTETGMKRRSVECIYIETKTTNVETQITSNQVTNNQNLSNQNDIDVDGIDF